MDHANILTILGVCKAVVFFSRLSLASLYYRFQGLLALTMFILKPFTTEKIHQVLMVEHVEPPYQVILL